MARKDGDVSERESLIGAPEPDSGIVGEGPLYEPMLANARALVDVWIPWGVENSQNWWGAPPFSVERLDDGTHRLYVETFGWEKRGLWHHKPTDLKSLRASAISLLVYCAAEEARDAR